MDVVRARSALQESRFSQISWIDETGSTNADLLDEARAGGPEQVLGAEFQTGGRGRLGRVWEAPRGGSVLCSVLIRPESAGTGSGFGDPHLVTSAMALSAALAIEKVCGIDVGIKWPNDLVAAPTRSAVPDDRKLAGILAESAVANGEIAAIVVGIGVNVNWPADLPAELRPIAVALNHLTGAPVDRTDLVVAMLLELDAQLAALLQPGGVARLRDAISERSATVGRQVRVERPTDELLGLAIGLGESGHLLVRDDEGVHDVSVGDVIHVRPHDQNAPAAP